MSLRQAVAVRAVMTIYGRASVHAPSRQLPPGGLSKTGHCGYAANGRANFHALATDAIRERAPRTTVDLPLAEKVRRNRSAAF